MKLIKLTDKDYIKLFDQLSSKKLEINAVIREFLKVLSNNQYKIIDTKSTLDFMERKGEEIYFIIPVKPINEIKISEMYYLALNFNTYEFLRYAFCKDDFRDFRYNFEKYEHREETIKKLKEIKIYPLNKMWK